MLSDLLSQTVTVISRSYDDNVDAYGNQVPIEAMTDVPGYVQQISGTERADAVPDATDLLILPAGTLIDTDDVVIDDDGLRYEVVGPPGRIWNPRTGVEHHVEATLRRTAGAEEAS